MSDIYKLQYNGMTIAYPGWNGYVGYNDVPKFKTLTLYASEGGTVAASVLTGMPGDTAQITTAYNTYYRFSGYDTAGGGSLNGDVYTFGNTNADISAVYKVNYFTATGDWEKGSDVGVTGNSQSQLRTVSIGAKYALHKNHTGDVPDSWYSTSNRWKPDGASAYQITLHPIIKFTGNYTTGPYRSLCQATGFGLIGTTQTANATTKFDSKTWIFNKTYTTTTQNVNYGLNGTVGALLYGNSRGQTRYIATGTTGTWTATGIAP